MVGDYKSYSIRTGLTKALCTLWILLPQIQSFSTMYLQDSVFLNTSLRIAATPAVTFAKGRTEALCNWSPLDRPPLQSIHCCIQNSFTKKLKNYTVSCVDTCKQATYKKCNKFSKQKLCATAALPEMNDMGDDNADSSITAHALCSIQGSATRASPTLLETMGLVSSALPWKAYLRLLQPTHPPKLAAFEANDKKNPKCPDHPKTIWLLLITMVLVSEFVHCLIAQEICRRHDAIASRRAAKSCKLAWGGFWAWVFRALLFLCWICVARN